MVSISSLLPKLQDSYPLFHFVASETASWSSRDNTIFYVQREAPNASYQLLHELGHALLGHDSYDQDIDLLKMERDAWLTAETIASDMGMTIPRESIETHLDSYRDWLHARSRCPRCDQAGIQHAKDGSYQCLLCHTKWRANEAKQCGLKRYQTKTSA